jgi:hypothetical protein
MPEDGILQAMRMTEMETNDNNDDNAYNNFAKVNLAERRQCTCLLMRI